MRHLDLFSGIGGFALGLESTGLFETAGFCEIEPFPRQVLARHWPGVPIYEDIHDVSADGLAADGVGPIGIITGGFPCQPFSTAGARRGCEDARWLWPELARVIAEVRPAWIILENVVGLRTLGADRVLADLAGADYACWPMVVGAVHAGAPHRRQRVWIVAHAANGGRESGTTPATAQGRQTDAQRDQRQLPGRPGGLGRDATHAPGQRRQTERQRWQPQEPPVGHDGKTGSAAYPNGQGQSEQPEHGQVGRELGGWDWSRSPEPVLRRVDDGLPCAMDRNKRLKALGNAVVPQVVAALGRAIAQGPGAVRKDMTEP